MGDGITDIALRNAVTRWISRHCQNEERWVEIQLTGSQWGRSVA
jgi:hypothetical protein